VWWAIKKFLYIWHFCHNIFLELTSMHERGRFSCSLNACYFFCNWFLLLLTY
jgi:hypothetical protein